MTAEIIAFKGAYKTPSERRVDQLVETIERVMADPSLAKNDKEREFARKLRERINLAPRRP